MKKSKPTPEQDRRNHKRAYARNPAAFKARAARWSAANPEYVKGLSIKKYWPGATALEAIANYNVLLQKQNGVCAICEKAESKIDVRTGKVKGLSVDHNHKTGKVRGLLCFTCNVSIGHFNEDPERIAAAISYLENWRQSQCG